MTISYPLALPAVKTARRITFRSQSVVGISQSPFTLQQQSQLFAGQMLMADVELPPMNRAAAEIFVAWLLSLNGRHGSFLLGDPVGRIPRGIATGTPLVRNRQNLLFYSEQLNQSVWSKLQSSVSADAIASPTGTLTADQLIENSAASIQPYTQQVVSGLTLSQQYTISIYIKDAGRNRGRLSATSNPTTSRFAVADFNLTTATTVMSAGGGAVLGSGGIQSVGNGWYRVSVTFTLGGTDTSILFRLELQDASGNQIYNGNGSSGMYLWGMQLERNHLGPYLVTTSAAIADQLQTGNVLSTDGWTPGTTNILRAGDWLQLGAGSSARLHKNLTDVNSDADGNAALDIWPSLRVSPANASAVVINNTAGKFMLASNQQSWSIEEARLYGISFQAVEDLRP